MDSINDTKYCRNQCCVAVYFPLITSAIAWRGNVLNQDHLSVNRITRLWVEAV